jgi:hypothetical protein
MHDYQFILLCLSDSLHGVNRILESNINIDLPLRLLMQKYKQPGDDFSISSWLQTPGLTTGLDAMYRTVCVGSLHPDEAE